MSGKAKQLTIVFPLLKITDNFKRIFGNYFNATSKTRKKNQINNLIK